MGYPSVVWQQQTEKALIITYNNTHLFQKPIPVWDPDYTTTFTTRFRPIPLVDDYNPTYIDPDCGRDPYWVTELYNQDLLQFQYVIDDNDHYNDTVHSRDKRMKGDVSNANEGSDATRNENSDWPDSAVYHKNPEKSLPDLSERQKTMQIFQNEILLMIAMHKSLQKGGMILSCPKYRKMMKEMKIGVLEVEDII